MQETLHPMLGRLSYPKTDKRKRIERQHGRRIIDYYDWLSQDGDDVRRWEAAQNELTRCYLDNLPYRAEVKAMLERHFHIDQAGAPGPVGDKLFQWRQKKSENHAVLFVGPTLENQEVVIDPNALSEDGSIAIDWFYSSQDGTYIAYGLSKDGSESSVLKVRSVESKQDLPDEIPHTPHSYVSWLADSSGFYYTRHPEPGTVPEGEEGYHLKIYLHLLGTNWKKDALIFAPTNPYDYPRLQVSTGGEWGILTTNNSDASNDLLVARIGTDPTLLDFTTLGSGDGYDYNATYFNGHFYITTNREAPKYRVMRVSSDENHLSDKSKWEVVVPEREINLVRFRVMGKTGIATYQANAHSIIETVNLATFDRHVIPLPAIGSVTQMCGGENQLFLYYLFESFAYPPSIFRLDIKTGEQVKVDGLKVDLDTSDIKVEEVTYHSKDGTPVTMIIVKHSSTQNDGNNKTILYGYGGFGMSISPAFSGAIVEWVRSGGIYVTANIRGGSEHGAEWHKAGILGNKQKVFDDFIAAAEYLIEHQYTQPKRLAIWGNSNGGLLVGATTVQRPELFGAVICQMPLLDMIHYDQHKIAKYWRSEYGDPANPDQFAYLYKYSPYHHVVIGTSYPPVLLQTAVNDTRVDPMHARKMAAKLQAATTSLVNPILLYVEDGAGHGRGKPKSKVLGSTVDVFAFLRATLGD